MKYSSVTLLLLLLALAIVLIPTHALENPCSYCSYCDFCSECHNCPCDPARNPNCKFCSYCAYCKLCSFCSACAEGGIVDKLSSAWQSVTSTLGFSLDEIKNEDVDKDLKTIDVETLRKKALRNRVKKDEL